LAPTKSKSTSNDTRLIAGIVTAFCCLVLVLAGREDGAVDSKGSLVDACVDASLRVAET
jgi:hypothetical protein